MWKYRVQITFRGWREGPTLREFQVEAGSIGIAIRRAITRFEVETVANHALHRERRDRVHYLRVEAFRLGRKGENQ